MEQEKVCGELTISPVVEVIDNSKLTTFMDCPRQFFYSHVLGWRVDDKFDKFHLIFGEAWHRAVEVVDILGFTNEAVEKAYQAFLEEYTKSFGLDETPHDAKTPGNALFALATYAETYKAAGFKPIYTEIAGVVPISDTRLIHFRLDEVAEKDGYFYFIDHKTGSQDSRPWRDQWATSSQMSTYTHAMYCHFEPEKVWGGRVRGAIFTKTKRCTHIEVPVYKTMAIMNAWLHNTNYWFERLEVEFDKLSRAKASDPVLEAFPLNTQSCTKYFGCKFQPFCTSWANPLQRCQTVPSDFVVEHWDPRARENDSTVRVQGGRWIETKKETDDVNTSNTATA